jgi:trehalose utilization protein
VSGTAPRVTVWNEFRHERSNEAVRAVYPEGIHAALAAGLREHGLPVRTATLDEPEHGLTDAALGATDVLVWWGHKAHAEVDDAVVERVHRRVLGGMGLVALHSAHYSKIFRRLMGTTCTVNWRVAGERERLWTVAPGHPIAAGVGERIDLAQEEMYGEAFGIPQPEALVFVSWFQGGEVFRSGCCFARGRGRVFYFRPGHETYPTYYNPQIRRVIANAVRWAASAEPVGPPLENRRRDPIEPLG